MTEKPSYYAVIPASVRYDSDLCQSAKLLYGEITALCSKEGFCWASNQYFAKLYDVHEKTVSEWIRQLSEAGHVVSVVEQNYKRRITLRENAEGVSGKHSTPPSGKPDSITPRESTTMTKPMPKFSFSLEDGFTGIPHEDLARWRETYPAVDVDGEILRAAEWLRANPTKMKSNYRRFLTNWFSRTQERGGTKGYIAPRPKMEYVHREPETLSDRERTENLNRLHNLQRTLASKKKVS